MRQGEIFGFLWTSEFCPCVIYSIITLHHPEHLQDTEIRVLFCGYFIHLHKFKVTSLYLYNKEGFY